MKKDSYKSIIDVGSNKLRLGVFDKKFSELFFLTKNISIKDDFDEYLKSIKSE